MSYAACCETLAPVDHHDGWPTELSVKGADVLCVQPALACTLRCRGDSTRDCAGTRTRSRLYLLNSDLEFYQYMSSAIVLLEIPFRAVLHDKGCAPDLDVAYAARC